MTYTLRFVPEIEEDVTSGYTWYEAKSPGLGEEFLRMFYAYAVEIARNPLLYPMVHGRFRRCLLRRFPYAVYFTIEDDQIIVFGLFHCARDPRAIRAKLRGRKEPEETLNKEREKKSLSPLKLPPLRIPWVPLISGDCYDYYAFSPKDRLKVKKKLRKIITSPAKLLPWRDRSNLYEGRYGCVFIVLIGPDRTKISFLILKAFTIGFATIWIIYAVIRWVLMGFIAGGFKEKK